MAVRRSRSPITNFARKYQGDRQLHYYHNIVYKEKERLMTEGSTEDDAVFALQDVMNGLIVPAKSQIWEAGASGF